MAGRKFVRAVSIFYRTIAARHVGAVPLVPFPLARMLIDGAFPPKLANDAAILNPMVDSLDTG